MFKISSEYCCNKELKKFPALKSMFPSRAEKEVIDKGASKADEPSKKLTNKFKLLQNAYEDPLTKVHLYFYTSALPLFTIYDIVLVKA